MTVGTRLSEWYRGLFTALKSALLFMQKQMLCLSSEKHLHIGHDVACRSSTNTAENKNQRAKSLLAMALGRHMQSQKHVNPSGACANQCKPQATSCSMFHCHTTNSRGCEFIHRSNMCAGILCYDMPQAQDEGCRLSCTVVKAGISGIICCFCQVVWIQGQLRKLALQCFVVCDSIEI